MLTVVNGKKERKKIIMSNVSKIAGAVNSSVNKITGVAGNTEKAAYKALKGLKTNGLNSSIDVLKADTLSLQNKGINKGIINKGIKGIAGTFDDLIKNINLKNFL